jgi:enoyl-CoA hydratase
MNYENITVEFGDGLAVVTVNRPKALNALNTATLQELDNAFDQIGKNREIKVVIITGAGQKAFIAGADISEMAKKTPLEAKEFSQLGLNVTRKMERIPQPIIAAINGYALGGGCEVAITCDIRVVTENAKFGQPEVGLGITPGFGGTQRLPRLIGRGRASEMLLAGRTISGKEALEFGLANHVVPADQLMEKAREVAQAIADKGSIAVQLAKSAILKGQDMDLDKALDVEADAFALCFSTEEQKEGMEAFLSKRKPNFKGV